MEIQLSATAGGSSNPQPTQQEAWRYCATCRISFAARRSYKRHLRENSAHNAERPYRCSYCPERFRRKSDRGRHERRGICLSKEQDLGNQSNLPAKRSLSVFEGSDEDSDEENVKAIRKQDSSANSNSGSQDVEWVNALEQFDFDFSETVLERSHSVSTQDVDMFDNVLDDYVVDEIPGLEIGVTINLSTDLGQAAASTSARTKHGFEAFERDVECPLDMPDLSCENSVPSSNPNLDTSPEVSHASPSTTVAALFNNEPAALPGPWDSIPNSKHRKKSGNVANRCTICKNHYEKDVAQLRLHLFRHLNELQQPSHFCYKCDIAFAMEDDLKFHLRSVETGNCGFPFQHVDDCTGHHSPNYSDETMFDDHDRFKLGLLLRSWEQSQLQLHQTSVHHMVNISTLTGRLSRLSVYSAPLRQSAVSRVYSVKSVKSCESEPYNMDPEVKFDEMEKGFADLRVGNAGIIRRIKRRIKHLPLVNDGIRKAAVEGNVDQVEFLLDQRANVDAPGRASSEFKDLTPLMLAAEQGHNDVVLCLLQHGASTKACDSKGETALHKSCANGHKKVAETILTFNAKIDKRDKEKHTALHKALLNRHEDLTLRLLREDDAKAVIQADGEAFLHVAVQQNSCPVVMELLMLGVDPTCVVDFTAVDFSNPETSEANRAIKRLGATSALVRATTLGFIHIVDLLLTAGAYAQLLPEVESQEPLKAAIVNDSVEVVDMLFDYLQKFSTAWMQDPLRWNNREIFCTAASCGAAKVLEVLLKRAAAISSLKKSTLLLVVREAARFEHFKAVGVALRFWNELFKDQRDLARMLCADTRQDVQELHYALSGGSASTLLFDKALEDECLEILRVLLASKCEKMGSNSQSALPMAACHFLAQTVSYLQAKDYRWNLLGAAEERVPNSILKPVTAFHENFLNELTGLSLGSSDRASKCGKRFTPLYFAAAKELVSIVSLLLQTTRIDAGINTLCHGETALCAAARNGSLKIVRKLLSHGANPILYQGVPTRCECKQDFLNRTLGCPLKDAVICEQEHLVEDVLADWTATPGSSDRLDFFGALFTAFAMGSVSTFKTILSSNWKISQNAATSLLEIVIAAGTQSGGTPYEFWTSSKFSVLLCITDALIEAGALLDRKRAEDLRHILRCYPAPPHLNNILGAMET